MLAGYTFYNPCHNTLYIRADMITPPLKGKSFREIDRIMEDVHKMPYRDRVDKYAPQGLREQILKQIDDNPDWKLSEYLVPHCGL